MSRVFVPADFSNRTARASSPAVSVADAIPDARDGLTRIERIVLWCLHETQRERGDRNVPTLMLYGRVCEHIDVTPGEFQRVLQRMVGVR